MSNIHPSSPTPYNQAAVVEALDNITEGFTRLINGFNTLKTLLVPDAMAMSGTTDFDPKDPANKFGAGKAMKLTTQGVEICYRLFDAGNTRYAVSMMMDISFGAADHRYKAWKKLGGVSRIKQSLN
jgi:hypothetical protein